MNPSIRKVLFVALLFLSGFVRSQDLVPHLAITQARCHGLYGGIEVISVSGGISPFYYSLDSISFSTNPRIGQLTDGDYVLYVRDDFGHFGSAPFSILAPEEIKVELSSSRDSVLQGEQFYLVLSIYPKNAAIDRIVWRPQQYFVENMNLINSLSINTSTIFAVEVSDTAFCIATAQKEVVVKKSQVFIPNVISLSSNTEAIFTVFGDNDVRKIRSMRIVDRYGRLVYLRKNLEPNDSTQGWNGYSRGKPVNLGVYFYQCEIEYESGQTQVFSGDLTVLK